MVELAPPEHSHTLLPDELSKMLFKGVEQESEIIINNRAIKKSVSDPSCPEVAVEFS